MADGGAQQVTGVEGGDGFGCLIVHELDHELKCIYIYSGICIWLYISGYILRISGYIYLVCCSDITCKMVISIRTGKYQ